MADRTQGSNGGRSEFSIGELARRVGLTPRTIRYYEDIGLLNSVARVDGGRRVYTDQDQRRLRFIQRLKLLGLTLDEMKALEQLYLTHRCNEKVLPHLLGVLNHHLSNLDSRIDQLQLLRKEIEAYRDHIREKL